LVSQDATEMLSAAAGFHCHDARQQLPAELYNAIARQPSTNGDLPGAIKTYDTADIFPKVNAENHNIRWSAPHASHKGERSYPITQ